MEITLVLLRGVIGLNLIQRIWEPGRWFLRLTLIFAFVAAMFAPSVPGPTKSFLGLALSIEVLSSALLIRRRPQEVAEVSVLVLACLALAQLD
jgi:hypothetical protein